jgi:hypothetical protein
MERTPVWRVAANILNMQTWIANKGWFSSLGGSGEVLTTPHHKNWTCYKTDICASDLDWCDLSNGKGT